MTQAGRILEIASVLRHLAVASLAALPSVCSTALVSAFAALLLAEPAAAVTKLVDVGLGGTLTFFDEESGTDTTTVMVGDTVNWVWQSSRHSTTRLDSPEAWNSDVQSAPFSFTHRFTTPGTYPYYCIPHQFLGMVGTVVVLPGSATTTTLPHSGSTTTTMTSSTTTTTIALRPEVVAGFDSIDEHLAGLRAAVDAAQRVARRRIRLAQQIQTATQATRRARGLVTLGRGRAAKGSLRQAMRGLAAFEMRVPVLTRRQRVSPETGAALLGMAESIRNDLGVLLHAV